MQCSFVFEDTSKNLTFTKLERNRTRIDHDDEIIGVINDVHLDQIWDLGLDPELFCSRVRNALADAQDWRDTISKCWARLENWTGPHDELYLDIKDKMANAQQKLFNWEHPA